MRYLVLLLLTGCLQGVGTGTHGSQSASSSGGGTDSGQRSDPSIVPANSGDLLPYLAAGSYKTFPHDDAMHLSQGPHGVGGVQAYYQPQLFDSLHGKATAHPAGAAAVMELFATDKTRMGWVVAVKTAPDSDGGLGWYWLEALDQGDSAKLVDEGQGLGLCTGCHATGDDYVL